MSVAQGEPDAPVLSSAAAEPPTDAEPPRLARRPALDGLRGLAVVAVLLFHGGYLTGGWLGVDLFFVLSGYLITSLLLVEARTEGRIGLGAFWARRARRLLPALLVMVVAVSVYAWADVAAVDLGAVRSDGLATLFFVANWHDILTGATYWDHGLAPSMFAHTWSLAVEEQLYLVWPLLLVAVLRGRASTSARTVARTALAAAAAAALISIGLRLGGASDARLYLGTDTRAVAVFLGAFVAGWRRVRRRSAAEARRLESLAIAAGVLLAVAWWRMDGTSSSTYWGGLLAASALGALVVAGAADARSTRLDAVLGVWPLRALGLISYGLYLWHWPVYVVLSPQRTGVDGLGLLAIRLGVTFALAIASWALIERPIRTMRPEGWWTGRRGMAAAVGSMAVAVAVLLVATSGAVDLRTKGLADGVARGGAVAGSPKVLVLGDSVAASLAAPAIDEPGAYGLEVVRSTVLGCQAVWDGSHEARGVEGDVSTPAACPPDVAALVRAEQPDAVLVAFGGWTNADLRVDGQWVGACDPAYRTLFRTRFAALLADAGSSGVPVVVADAPRSTNTFRQEDTWERTACTNEDMTEVAAAASATVIDLDEWVCPGGTCRERVDGVPLRSDGVHFQGPGGAAATRWVLGEVVRHAGLERTVGEQATASAEDRALVTVCRSYVELTGLTTGELGALLDSAEARDALAASLLEIDDAVLDDLPSDLAADLRPLADPAFQQWAVATLDAISRGAPVSAEALAPGTLESIGKATTRLSHEC